jgi:hypothetical protein
MVSIDTFGPYVSAKRCLSSARCDGHRLPCYGQSKPPLAPGRNVRATRSCRKRPRLLKSDAPALLAHFRAGSERRLQCAEPLVSECRLSSDRAKLTADRTFRTVVFDMPWLSPLASVARARSPEHSHLDRARNGVITSQPLNAKPIGRWYRRYVGIAQYHRSIDSYPRFWLNHRWGQGIQI